MAVNGTNFYLYACIVVRREICEMWESNYQFYWPIAGIKIYEAEIGSIKRKKQKAAMRKRNARYNSSIYM